MQLFDARIINTSEQENNNYFLQEKPQRMRFYFMRDFIQELRQDGMVLVNIV